MSGLLLSPVSEAFPQGALPALELPFAIEGPPPPELPATVARDAEGRITVRAIRLGAPLRIDGQLDETLYRDVEPASDFIQAEPHPGGTASEKTEVWISFDSDNVYVSVRAFESQPERMVLTSMRRDSNQTWQNECLGVSFDTFYDRRNSVSFQFTPIGGWADGQFTNEAQYNGDWNPVWTFSVRRNEGGWTGEAAIPFKSLRYRPGRGQIWGLQLRRINRWKNEMSHLTRVPDGIGVRSNGRASQFATLVGIEAPPPTRAFDVKPYVTSNLTTDVTATPRIRNEVGGDFGADMKYAVTQNITADFTYNTDFAQVEADEQQVNLTRFSLFFPEKRDFFIENQGLFNFGGAGATGRMAMTAGDVPVLFYSRRIGLDRGALIPIQAGGRLTGQLGRTSIGLVNMQTSDVDRLGVPSTNFAVARVKRDILRRSAVGALFTRRSSTVAGTGSAETYGLDGAFAFFSNLAINTYWARTQTPGAGNDNTSYYGNFNYNGDRYGLELAQLKVGDNFVSGGRVRPARRHAPQLRTRPLQSSPPQQPARPEVRLGGIVHLRGERRRHPRDARAQRRVPHRVCKQQHPGSFDDRRVRAAAGAVPDRAWRDDSVGRLRPANGPSAVLARPAASRLWRRLRRARVVLSRRQDGVRVQRRVREAQSPALHRAWSDGEPRDAALRRLHVDAPDLSRHLYVHPAHVYAPGRGAAVRDAPSRISSLARRTTPWTKSRHPS